MEKNWRKDGEMTSGNLKKDLVLNDVPNYDEDEEE